MVTCVVIIAILSTRLLTLFEQNEAKQMSARHEQQHHPSSHAGEWSVLTDHSHLHHRHHSSNLLAHFNATVSRHVSPQIYKPAPALSSIDSIDQPYESFFPDPGRSSLQYQLLQDDSSITTTTTTISAVPPSQPMNHTDQSDDLDLFGKSAVSTVELVFRLIGAIFCILIILTTIVGNVLVIIVVTRFHRMRSVTNILLASLAVADITVACLVMPFTVVYDVVRFWPWGSVLCHFWISCDVMCCTASILHLCCVAIDRFWAITRPLRYRTYISKKRLFCCIVCIWICSVAISFIPIFSGWYHADGRINVFTMQSDGNCGLNVNPVYALISSLTSFYLPLPIMFYVYFRILLVAEKQSREIKQLEQSLQQNGFLANVHFTPAAPNIMQKERKKKDSDEERRLEPLPSRSSEQKHKPTIHFGSLINVDTGETGYLNGSNSMDTFAAGGESSNMENKRHAERSLRRRTRQLITDTKAIRTLGIVMGVFCLCWLPFFIMYVISAYCASCDISYELRSGITWLGYINSALNPAIYAYLNKEFKNAFKQAICCMSIAQINEMEREAMYDELSTNSRTYQRNVDRVHGGRIDVPPTPGFISRTPSATPETTWPIMQSHNPSLAPTPPGAPSTPKISREEIPMQARPEPKPKLTSHEP